MGVGHIKLGTSVAALRDYILTDPRARVRELANPYAAKVGMGAGKYDDLTSWSAWVMDNWEAGIGREKATDGGLAYSSLDSRVPNQLILPPAMGRVGVTYASTTNGEQQFMPADCTAYGTVTIGEGQANDTILVRVKTGTGNRRAINLYVRLTAAAIGDLKTIQQLVYSDDAGAPDALLSTQVTWGRNATAADMIPVFEWLDAASLYSSFADSTYYWVGFRVTKGTMTVLLGDGNSASSTVTGASGAAPWTTNAYDAIFQVCEDNDTNLTYLPSRRPLWMGDTSTGKTYLILYEDATNDAADAVYCYQYNDSTNNWTLKATSNHILNGHHCAAWCGSIYVPASQTSTTPDQSYISYPEDDSSFTTYGLVGSVNQIDGFAVSQGYLWAWAGNDLYYSNEEAVTVSDWSGPIAVGSSSYPIQSVCQFGDFTYVATEEALWYIGYGDVPIHVLTFPSRSANTGISMVQHMGALYVTVAGRVWQYSATGQVMDVWFPYTGDTSIQRGDVIDLCSSGYNLYAVALPDTGAASDHNWYVYSWNGQGWHPVMIAQSPWGVSGSVTSPINPSGTLYYGRHYNKLFLAAGLNNVYWARIPDSFLNPFRDTAQEFAYTGYCTTPWFDGELIDVSKDYESVFATGESLSSVKPVDVYWQDDASTAWEYLGRIDTAGGEEVRWSTYATRPSTKRFRLALVFYTTSPTATPQVTGVRVKYRANVQDRWRWTLPVAVHPNQQFPDGSMNAYTAAEMRTHLEALAKQVPPVFFQDVDGKQYEVWVTNCREQIIEYEYYNSAHYYMQQFLLSIEQVQSASVN